MTYLWVLWFLFCFVKSAVESLYWIFWCRHCMCQLWGFLFCLSNCFLFFYVFLNLCWTSHLVHAVFTKFVLSSVCSLKFLRGSFWTVCRQYMDLHFFRISFWILLFFWYWHVFLSTLFFVILLSLHWYLCISGSSLFFQLLKFPLRRKDLISQLSLGVWMGYLVMYTSRWGLLF